MNKLCPFCNTEIETSLTRHIKAEHGEETLRKAILTDKRNGMPDAQIGEKYGISFSYLERVITQEYGTNISTITHKKSKITQWEPKGFQLETTTVWSFKNRGNWATHDGRYRGNWSPYIPRNLILRYSQLREVVLDYFCGAGTTAVEAKLLGRRCIARDINPDALALAKENLDFQLPQNVPSGNGDTFVDPELVLGDARDLSSIETDSIDLICAHPPYAGIISYSANEVEGDLSTLSVPEFLAEMQKVARESYRVLKPGRQCAILIGDSRKSKRIVPIGFLTILVFLNAGFKLRELIIKRQHNCKTTGFWYSNSIRYNFLLLAHEFLPVFEKPAKLGTIAESRQLWLPTFQATHEEVIERIEREQLETTSVWIFPIRQMQAEIRRNLLGRFAKDSGSLLEIDLEKTDAQIPEAFYPLAHIRCCSYLNALNHFELLDKAVEKARRHLSRDGFCVIETRDFRQDSILIPMGLLTFEHLDQSGLELREIVIVTSEENQPFEPPSEGYFGISHKYLLIYRKP
ncbi:MAG TPA: DNA methyltransferase [Anaerolineae bacterium]|mgnify:CR=1 FL=1|nr:DNA methyltransferase [Anaerolineae bacterium]HQI86929.1 DNA methyltransferase [Anaerolineae bacterium]